jgi:hypothetical protein
MRTPEYRVLAFGNAGNDDNNAQDGGDRLGAGRSADIRRRVTHLGEPGANPRNPGEHTLRSGDRIP